MYYVWIDFGDGTTKRFDFNTVAERIAFKDGIHIAALEWGKLDSYRLATRFEDAEKLDPEADEPAIS